MVSASVLEKYKEKYEIKPPRSVSKLHKKVRRSLKTVNTTEHWLKSRKPKFILQKPLTAPPPRIALTTLPDNTDSLASLGGRLKQVEFLTQHGLAPPPDVLNLDAWLIARLQEIRTHIPLQSWTPSLTNWLALNQDQREYVLNAERSVDQFKRLNAVQSQSIVPQFSSPSNSIPSAFTPLSSIDFTELRPSSTRRASQKASEKISETFSGAGSEIPAGSLVRSARKPRNALIHYNQ